MDMRLPDVETDTVGGVPAELSFAWLYERVQQLVASSVQSKRTRLDTYVSLLEGSLADGRPDTGGAVQD